MAICLKNKRFIGTGVYDELQGDYNKINKIEIQFADFYADKRTWTRGVLRLES